MDDDVRTCTPFLGFKVRRAALFHAVPPAPPPAGLTTFTRHAAPSRQQAKAKGLAPVCIRR